MIGSAGIFRAISIAGDDCACNGIDRSKSANSSVTFGMAAFGKSKNIGGVIGRSG